MVAGTISIADPFILRTLASVSPTPIKHTICPKKSVCKSKVSRLRLFMYVIINKLNNEI